MRERLLVLILPLLLLSSSGCNASVVDSLWHSLTAWLHLNASLPNLLDGPVCLNMEGTPVDWWIAMKLPGADDLAYLDSQDAAKLGEQARFRYMPAEASALDRTLRQLYADEHGTYSGGATSADDRLGRPGHIMYSDEPPLVEGLSDEDSFGFAFTQGKGVMGYGEQQGFWLVHSVPSFPAAPRKGAYSGVPRREAGNAHTFLCMSAATRQLSATSATLRANAYYVYSEAAPEQARGLLSDAQRAAFPDLVGLDPDQDAAKAGFGVKVTEFETLKGERFVVFANDGQRPGVRVMRDIVQSYFGNGMLYANPPPDQGSEEGPCQGGDSVFPSLHAREYFLEDADIAWTAAEDLSTWAISLGGQSRCRDAAAAAEPAASMQPDQASVDKGALVQQDVQPNDESPPMWSQTMTRPVASASRRRLLASQPLPDQRRAGGLRAWFGDLAAEGKAWWRTVRGVASSEDAADDTSFLPAVPLYTPPDASYPSAAAGILQSRADALQEAAAAAESAQDTLLQERPMLRQQREASDAWRVDGVAYSVAADADEEAFLALPELGNPDQEPAGCMDGSCKTAKLAERVAALEEKLQRLENFVVEADDDLADDVDELANDDEDNDDELEEEDMRNEGGEDGIAQALMSGCDQSAAQRSVACMHDAGRSLQSADLPGGVVCSAGNPAIWAALRDLVQSAEVATASRC